MESIRRTPWNAPGCLSLLPLIMLTACHGSAGSTSGGGTISIRSISSQCMSSGGMPSPVFDANSEPAGSCGQVDTFVIDESGSASHELRCGDLVKNHPWEIGDDDMKALKEAAAVARVDSLDDAYSCQDNCPEDVQNYSVDVTVNGVKKHMRFDGAGASAPAQARGLIDLICSPPSEPSW